MRLSEWFEGLRKIDINDLDTNNMGSWPPAIKVTGGCPADGSGAGAGLQLFHQRP